MHFTAAITALSTLTTITAIDIHLHSNLNCKGTATICRNANPGDCCSVNTPSFVYHAASIAFRAIPTDWNIEAEAHLDYKCGGNIAKTQWGAPDICISEGPYKVYPAGRYRFRGRKARSIAAEEACNRVRPDVLSLANGTQYDLTSLDEVDFNGITSFLHHDTAEDDLHQHIQTLELKRLA